MSDCITYTIFTQVNNPGEVQLSVWFKPTPGRAFDRRLIPINSKTRRILRYEIKKAIDKLFAESIPIEKKTDYVEIEFSSQIKSGLSICIKGKFEDINANNIIDSDAFELNYFIYFNIKCNKDLNQ